MIKHIPILLVIIGIVVIIIGFNLVMDYGLNFLSGISLFFGIAMIGVGVDLKRKMKKLVSKNKKAQYDYTIQKMTESISKEDTPLDILKKRYASGEISEEEFNKIKEDLE
jgi:uncharacterized membrane protein